MKEFQFSNKNTDNLTNLSLISIKTYKLNHPFYKNMAKTIISKDNKHYILDEEKDFHCNYGMLKKEDIKKAKPGEVIKTNTGKELTVISPFFIDYYDNIKRSAQIIPRKDIGLIITELGLNRESIVIEAGAGSGATGCFLAKICKKVYSYEIREDFFNLVKKNIDFFKLDNLELKNQDAKEGFKEKDVDAVILDLPDPWELIEQVYEALKPGGFIVSYSPTIPQVMDFVEKIKDKFVHIKTSEIMEREWDVRKRVVRPKSQSIGHSGFLTFGRKTK